MKLIPDVSTPLGLASVALREAVAIETRAKTRMEKSTAQEKFCTALKAYKEACKASTPPVNMDPARGGR